jgi:uncharacterized membrane protein YesL
MIELSYNEKMKDTVLDWVLTNPDQILPLLGRKMLAFFGPAGNLFLDIVDLLLIPFYISGLVRIILQRDNWRKIAFITGSVLLTQIFISLVFCGGYRYRIIIYPGLLLLAVHGLPDEWVAWLSQIKFLRGLMNEDRDRSADA